MDHFNVTYVFPKHSRDRFVVLEQANAKVNQVECLRADLEQKLNRQSEQLALALRAKNAALEEVATLNNEASARMVAHFKQVKELTEELKKLRPPEPRFRVDQIVAFKGTSLFYKIADRCLENGLWRYKSYQAYWYPEGNLRALEEQEK